MGTGLWCQSGSAKTIRCKYWAQNSANLRIDLIAAIVKSPDFAQVTKSSIEAIIKKVKCSHTLHNVHMPKPMLLAQAEESCHSDHSVDSPPLARMQMHHCMHSNHSRCELCHVFLHAFGVLAILGSFKFRSFFTYIL